MKNFKLTYSPITPTHIGSGHTYEPFEYVIQKNTFYHLNIDNLLADLTNDEKQKFYKLCNGGSIVDIRNLIAKQFISNPEKYTRFSANVPNCIQKKYKEKFNDYKNQMQIAACYHNLISAEPVITGSSVKGAIRTALLDKIAEYKNVRTHNDFEFELLDALNDYGKKDVTKDPFNNLLVSDATFPLNSTHIYSVYNRPRYSDKQNNLPPFEAEFFDSLLFFNSENEMDINDDFKPAVGTLTIKKKFKPNAVFETCDIFYKLLLDNFKDFLDNQIYEYIKKSTNPNKNSFLIRCGKFSGKESFCITKLMKGKKPDFINYVQDELLSGWIKVEWKEI